MSRNSRDRYDLLPCARCDGGPVRPSKINRSGSARYVHDCEDGIEFRWTVSVDGEIVNEVQYASAVSKTGAA